MPTSKRWVVTTAGPQHLPAIAQQLTQAGFTVEQTLDAIGCLTGTASDGAAERARAIPGVADVSPEAPSSIGPPDSSLTW